MHSGKTLAEPAATKQARLGFCSNFFLKCPNDLWNPFVCKEQAYQYLQYGHILQILPDNLTLTETIPFSEGFPILNSQSLGHLQDWTHSSSSVTHTPDCQPLHLALVGQDQFDNRAVQQLSSVAVVKTIKNRRHSRLKMSLTILRIGTF